MPAFAEILNESHAQVGRAGGFASGRGANGGDDLGGRCFFEEITTNAKLDGFDEEFRVIIHAEQEDLDARFEVEEVVGKKRGSGVLEGIHQNHIAPGGEDLVFDGFRAAADADNIDFGALSEQTGEGVTKQAIFG